MPYADSRLLTYGQHRVDPVARAAEIRAVDILGPMDEPNDPTDFTIDQALLARLNWRPGDRLTLVPTPLDGRAREGRLVIRKAQPGEPCFTLPHFTPARDKYPQYDLPLSLSTPQGPRFDWVLPRSWTNVFLPIFFRTVNDDYSGTDSTWMLDELLDQTDELVLKFDCSGLQIFIQRTTPVPTTLNVHPAPGLLQLMGWDKSTPLCLESGAGFQPGVSTDVLTLRVARADEVPNLKWDENKMVAEVMPFWLKQLLPSYFRGPDHIVLPEDQESWIAEYDYLVNHPHTACVSFPQLTLQADAITFNLKFPAAQD